MNFGRRHFLAALLLHVLLFGLLFTGLKCSHDVDAPPVVQGVLINPSDLPNLAAVKPSPQPTPPAPEAPKPPPPTPTPPAPTPPKPDVAEQQKAAEQQHQQEEAQAAAEAKTKAEAQAKADTEAAQKEKADLQAKVKEEADAKAKADADAKAKADAQAKTRDDLAAQAAKEEQERKAQAAAKQEAAAQRKQAEADLRQQLGQESQAINQQVLAEWNAQLIAAIQSNWARPPGADLSLKCKIHMDLAPNGQLLSANVVSSSGNALFDSSVVAAVYKASPLPLPKDPTVFQSGINVTFVPSN